MFFCIFTRNNYILVSDFDECPLDNYDYKFVGVYSEKQVKKLLNWYLKLSQLELNAYITEKPSRIGMWNAKLIGERRLDEEFYEDFNILTRLWNTKLS